jgi:OmpA-OmpF porin, OOP family
MSDTKDRRHFHGRKTRIAITGSLATVAAVAVLAHAAYAQSDNAAPARSYGFYIGLGAGANIEERNHFTGGRADATDTYDAGPAGIVDLGYGLGNGLRLELEPGYSVNQLDQINGGSGSGRMQMATVMGNLLYDFNYVTPWIPLQPHLGIGVGYAHLWDRSSPQNGVGVSGQDDVPAFQGIAGLDYPLTPAEKIGIDYHYLVAHDADFHVNNGLTTRAGDVDNHTFLVTFRYQFGVAPQHSEATPAAAAYVPPPPPPPPPSPPRPFEVYFDFNSALLTPEGRIIVDQAAANAKQGQAVQIMATGHTDTVGTESYNQVLSVKRANAVRAALVADGVSAGEIQVSGVGERDLAVPTAANVNEPRNRRVEIVIQAPGM